MSSEGFNFPSPIGGVPFPIDYAPSIVFAVLYGLLIPLVFFRVINKVSRNIVLIGTIAFSIERIVVMALRSQQAHNEHKRTVDSLTIYMKTTLSVGYFSMASDLANLLRCLLVAATQHASSNPTNIEARAPDAYLVVEDNRNTEDDREKERTLYRQICGFTGLFGLIPLIIGIYAAARYAEAEKNESDAHSVKALRYASAIMGFLMLLVVQSMAAYGFMYTRNVIKSSVIIIFSLATLLNVVSVYHLCVLHFTTTSLTSTAPGSLNSTLSKVAFYVFQLTPEWISAAVLLGINARKRFNTGMWGDRIKKKKAKNPGEGRR